MEDHHECTCLDRCRTDRGLVSRSSYEIVVGVVGGLLGGWLASSVLHIGAEVNGINLESILVAFLGAVVLLILLRLISGRR
jgi:uncharacterized membrane protein YeaQ/YmgE (transglycosylase-associated protein family)